MHAKIVSRADKPKRFERGIFTSFQVDHFVRLFETLENPEELQIERLVQILQAAVTARCVHGKSDELRRVLESLPSTQLRDIVLEYNVVDFEPRSS